ncbi:RNA polymerase sigma factor [Cryobacterium aureum]|uniref:RNA polymerase sigma factor n=1 Tax=Cryobacterium aureum TaxID=995037 RepID=UPI000CF47243|nr:sigma-70 family RNA polymerase sigma factor [Cryobacterium aureum]
MSARTEDKRSRISRAVPEHAPALLAYFARRIDPPYDAADLLAETLLILWKRANGLPADDDEIRPWMFGIARHVLLHHQRSTARRNALADRLRSQMSLVVRPGFSDSSTFDDLHDAIRELDQTDRDIIGLHHWDGLSLVEVSRVLRMKEGTVRSRYHRARERLRHELAATTTIVTFAET